MDEIALQRPIIVEDGPAEIPEGESTGRNGSNYQARRDRIIATATRLFAKRGFVGTSVNDICAEDSLPRGLLYYYVPGGKIELLQAINDRFQGTLLRTLPGLADPNAPSEDNLRKFSRVLMAAIFEYLDEVTVFFNEWKHLKQDQARWEQHRQKRKAIQGILRAEFERGQRAGAFRQVPADIAVNFFFSAHNWAYQWIRKDGKLSADELSDMYCEMFFAGFRVPSAESTAQLRPSPPSPRPVSGEGSLSQPTSHEAPPLPLSGAEGPLRAGKGDGG
jgi:AcrR family transcriptional regulator